MAWFVKMVSESNMLENQTIKEVRAARRKISEQYGHDSPRLCTDCYAKHASVVSHKRLELFFAVFGRFDRAAVEPGLICSKV